MTAPIPTPSDVAIAERIVRPLLTEYPRIAIAVESEDQFRERIELDIATALSVAREEGLSRHSVASGNL